MAAPGNAVPVPSAVYTPWSYAHFLRGKLGALAPGPAALLPRTSPSSNGINGLYGHGFYGNGTPTDTECWKSGITDVISSCRQNSIDW